jgi:hypothetical protein
VTRALPDRRTRVSATPTVDPPGYPLEAPGAAWAVSAACAYTFAAVVVFNDVALPSPLRDLIFGVFRDHQTIVKLGLGALTLHVGYLVFALGLSRKRGYDVRASAWWAVTCFYFGTLSFKMLLDKEVT